MAQAHTLGLRNFSGQMEGNAATFARSFPCRNARALNLLLEPHIYGTLDTRPRIAGGLIISLHVRLSRNSIFL